MASSCIYSENIVFYHINILLGDDTLASDDAIQFGLLILLLLLSAFFSSAETAMTTVNKIRIKTLADEENKRAQTLLIILEHSGKMLSAILIGNNVVNLSASALATSLALRLFGRASIGIVTGILTLLVLIFGEITPKTLATIHSEKLALSYSSIIWNMMRILTPVIFLVEQLSMLFLRLLRIDAKAGENAMTEEELLTLVDMSHEDGVIESEEREIIYNVFEFGDAQAKDVMVPRVDMVSVSLDDTYDTVVSIFRKEKFTRLMGDSRQKISPEKLTIIQNRTPITFTHIWEWRMRQLR